MAKNKKLPTAAELEAAAKLLAGKGGRNGTGKAKARSAEVCRKAAAASHVARRKKKKESIHEQTIDPGTKTDPQPNLATA